MTSTNVSISIKPASGGEAAKFIVEVSTSSSIAELKQEVEGHGSVPAAEMRLIYKGQILKDEKTVEEYGIQSGHVVHMVRGQRVGASQPDRSTATAAPGVPTANAGGFAEGLGGGFGLDAAAVNNPLMQSLVNNPELMRSIMMSNPQVQQVLQSNPELAQVLNNPSIMSETMRLMQNPNLMREHMRNADVAMRNIEGMPEGFNHLRRMYETMEPMMSGMGGGDAAAANPLAALFGGAAPAASPPATAAGTTATDRDGGPNNAPLPNPWSSAAPATGGAPAAAGGNPFAALAGLGGAGGLGGMPMPDPAGVAALMQQPEAQAVMQQLMSNPATMQAMLSMDPNMRRLVDAVPGMREMMADPNMLRLMFNPQMIQAAAQARSGGLSGAGTPAAGPAGQMPDMSQLLGLLGAGQGQGGGLASLLGGGLGVPPVSNPEEAYASQLQQLADMGFVDRAANTRALVATQGNVNAAVERLLGGL